MAHVNYGGNAFGAGLAFYKTRGSTAGSHTIVQDGDDIGIFDFYGSNGSAYERAARILVEVDGTPGVSGDMPGRITFLTSPDGSASATEALRIDSNQNTLIDDGNGLVVGHTAQITAAALTSELQVL